MKISARADYALRAVIELASTPSGRASAPEIAEAQQIPRQFLDSIMGDLRRAGFVASQRGVGGGFRLVPDGDKITVSDVIVAVDGPLTTVRGLTPEHLAYDGSAKPLRELWIALRSDITERLEGVTIADLVSCRVSPSET